MRQRNNLQSAVFALLVGAAPFAGAVDLSFLDQAPVRFLSDADTELMDATVGEVLEEAKDGESRTWQGAESGSSGTVTAVRTFQEGEHECRRIRLLTNARRATGGQAESMVDLCRIEGEWKLLRMP
jgi:surface antigen